MLRICTRTWQPDFLHLALSFLELDGISLAFVARLKLPRCVCRLLWFSFHVVKVFDRHLPGIAPMPQQDLLCVVVFEQTVPNIWLLGDLGWSHNSRSKRELETGDLPRIEFHCYMVAVFKPRFFGQRCKTPWLAIYSSWSHLRPRIDFKRGRVGCTVGHRLYLTILELEFLAK